MPYRNGVWRPARDASKARAGDRVETVFGVGTIEGSASGESVCVRINGLVAVVAKGSITDVLFPSEKV